MAAEDKRVNLESFVLKSHESRYQGRVIHVYQDTVLLPNGHEGKWDVIDHKGAAGVIPVLDDGRILMVRQYRHAIGEMTLEIPAGGRDFRFEDTKQTAARELEEETGYSSHDISFLISLNPVAAYSNEKIDIYVAKNLIPSNQHLDDDEFIDVKAYKIEDLIAMIYSTEIKDAKTIAALLAFKDCMKNP